MSDNKLERNNLDAQLSLMKDIISNNKSITYELVTNAEKVLQIFRNKKSIDKDRLVTFTYEQFDEMFNIMCNLSDERRFEYLGILSKTKVPDNEIKKEILAILQKS